MAVAESELKVAEKGISLPVQESSYNSEDLIRWNDYGIGLLLQGDLRAAEQIFIHVTEIDPAFVDGWVNLGRARLLEGRTQEGQDALLKAVELAPDLARSNFFLGMTYKNQGEYDKALVHLRAAETRYPRDRVVLNQIGRILFLQRQSQEAVAVLNRVVEIDPEDLQAHYNLMLCYRALAEPEKAQREQKLYLRFKADESSQAIVGPYLRDHPEDNNERQAIHEHTTYPLDRIGREKEDTLAAGQRSGIATGR
jgi:tetratricopeptide (TPR) repeat protein